MDLLKLKKNVFLEIYFRRKFLSIIIVLHKEIFSNLNSKDQKKNKAKDARLLMNKEGNFGPTKSLIAKVTSQALSYVVLVNKISRIANNHRTTLLIMKERCLALWETVGTLTQMQAGSWGSQHPANGWLCISGEWLHKSLEEQLINNA